MPSTPQQVLKTLQQQQYAPVYFLQGEEVYYIDLLTNYVEHHVLRPAERDFNLTVVYGKDQTMGDILTHARRFPMGSARQVVIVKEAQMLPDLHHKAGGQLLAAYVQAPQPATLLVWAYKYKTLDARSTLSKLLAQHAVLVHCKKLYEHQLGAWITAYVQERGQRITTKAAALLQACIGNELPRLASELRKICLNLKGSTEIDVALVQTYVGISRTFNAFELQKAVAQKAVHKAQQIAHHLGHQARGSAAPSLVALLFTFFSKLLLLHHAQDKSERALAKVLQINPYFVREYLLAAQHYPLPKVIENIHHLHQADLQLKGVDHPPTPAGEVLQELVFKLMYSYVA